MNFLRRLLLPAFVATPLWMWLEPVVFRGWLALTERPSLDSAALLGGATFTLAGLLIIGLPAAALVARWQFAIPIATALLVLIGTLGGTLIAILCLIALGGSARVSWGESAKELLQWGGTLGAVPGATVAFVWSLINFDALGPRLRGYQHG